MKYCTCTGTCRGPDGLGEGWVCVLQKPTAAIAPTAWHDWKGVTEPDWYWWWNGDPDSAPVPVAIGGSWNGKDYDRFAQTGQLGWTWAQPVEQMGGLWCRAMPPEIPKEEIHKAIYGN